MPEAVWFEGPQRVAIRQEPAAPVGPDDVRVRSLVSGMSAGSELLVYRGSAPRELQPDLPSIRGDFGFPIKFAYASVGRVIEVGSRVAAAGGGRPRLRAPPASDRVRRAGRRSDPAARRPASRRRGVRSEPRDGRHGGARRPPPARRSGPRDRPGRRRPADHHASPEGRRDADRDRRSARATSGRIRRSRRGPRTGRGRRPRRHRARADRPARRGRRGRGQRKPGRSPGLHRRRGVRRDRRRRVVVRDSRRQPEPRWSLPSPAPAGRQLAGLDARSGPRATLGSGSADGPGVSAARRSCR